MADRDLVRLGRFPERGSHEFAAIAAILDEALVCHVGVSVRGQPVVLPTTFARRDRHLYIHGSTVARWMGALTSAPLCLTVSILDAIVLARSAYNHTLNYRSVVVFGQAERVTDAQERRRALEAIVEHVCPGRSSDTRPPSAKELKATSVLRIDLATASAKTREGPPVDFDEDYGKGIWAGVIPVRTVRGAPIPDARLEAGVGLPYYLGR
ncbi:MAG TPA: pyridoxamine 5'-phosphate oxidase family protein [Candidatus Acidoferrales bacterium]|nr:pyridoxamine 5'-phosphate oxidase family protein [Candidatus Acidoferrales bacterium]HTX57993.1 pyridoxamine 5'-phosphate oxidase family protein [Candidatus Acidoferrales bacterium]